MIIIIIINNIIIIVIMIFRLQVGGGMGDETSFIKNHVIFSLSSNLPADAVSPSSPSVGPIRMQIIVISVNIHSMLNSLPRILNKCFTGCFGVISISVDGYGKHFLYGSRPSVLISGHSHVAYIWKCVLKRIVELFGDDAG